MPRKWTKRADPSPGGTWRAELLSGRILWKRPFRALEYWEGKQPVLAGNELYVPGFKGIFAFDKDSGGFRYQVADYHLNTPEARFSLNIYGQLTRLGDELFVGTDNGSFYSLSLK